MRSLPSRMIAALVIAVGVTGCKKDPSGARRVQSTPPAQRSLDATIDRLTTQLDAAPTNNVVRRSLVDALVLRSVFFGDTNDLDRIAKAAAEPFERAGFIADSTAHLTRARARMALHRWRDALADLDGAVSLGTSTVAVDGPRAECLQRRLRFDGGSPDAAAAFAARGLAQYDEADRHFDKALKTVGVSEFAAAWLHTERGIMWVEDAAQPDRGAPHLRAAVATVPGYVEPHVQLSRLGLAKGDAAAVVARLEPIARPAIDPRVGALLASAYQRLGRTEEAEPIVKQARYDFAQLLRQHRAAHLGTGVDFYLGVGGEPSVALGLAKEHVKQHPSDRALERVIRAAQAAGHGKLACNYAKTIQGSKRHESLAQLVERVAADCH